MYEEEVLDGFNFDNAKERVEDLLFGTLDKVTRAINIPKQQKKAKAAVASAKAFVEKISDSDVIQQPLNKIRAALNLGSQTADA